jgi:SAM-dependent methyltransferase
VSRSNPGGTESRTIKGMRAFWDARARENAAWYVDTSLAFDDPDMERFFETGRQIVADALDEAPVLPDGRALAVEVGSGLGRVCAALAARFDHVIGLDISPEMVMRAREFVGAPTISFLVGDGISLAGVGDEVADLVLTFTVFQHIPSVAVIDGYLHEAARVLRPGGVLVMQWNNTSGAWRWRIRRGWLALLQRTRIRPEQYLRHAPQFLGSRVPLRRIRRALAHAGLELRGIRNGGTLYAWAWVEKPNARE